MAADTPKAGDKGTEPALAPVPSPTEKEDETVATKQSAMTESLPMPFNPDAVLDSSVKMQEMASKNMELMVQAAQGAADRQTVRSFTRRRPARKPFPDHLERERVVIPGPQTCPCCTGALHKLGEDTTETLERIPARLKVIVTVREKMVCRRCEAIHQPPAPFHVIARGRAGPGLLAAILHGKFADHLPLTRQSAAFAREGVDLDVSTLADRVGASAATLAPLVGLIRGQGGEIRLGREVVEITTDRGRATGVRLGSGEEIRADIVVSNADTAWTYSRLLAPGVRRRWTDRRVGKARYSMGLFIWYFGTDRQYPDIPHHTIMMGPRYKGLLQDIFQRKVLAEDFSLYLHRPTATDPALAPPGCDTFYVLSPVPHLGAGIDWTTTAERYRQAIAAHLNDTLLPGLDRAVVTSRVATPLDFRDKLLSVHGAAFGMEPVLTQSAWFRPHNRSEDVRNLFLVGAGTHPGAGLPGVLSSARVLDNVVPDAAAFV